MIKLKIFLILLFSISLFLFGVYAIPGIPDYMVYKKVAESAALSGKMQEAGRIMAVKPCIRDTPVILPIECAVSCPFVNAALKPLCSKPVADAVACIVAAQSAGNPLPGACSDLINIAMQCLACDLYYELPMSEAQFGNIFMGVPKTFTNYKGGGTFPQPGSQFIWLGSSNLSPYVMGIPSLAGQRTENVVNQFDNIITVIKHKVKETFGGVRI